MSDIASGLSIAIMICITLLGVVLFVLSPLMLYAIHSRLGETNDLLRYLANREAARDKPA